MAACGRVWSSIVFLGVWGAVVCAGAQEQRARSATPQPPANIAAHDSVRELLAQMMRRSPTIRRQCAEIAAARRVAVTIRLTGRMSGGSRARTTMSKYEAGFIRAVMEIPIGADLVELLAHELEHVTEQIDGIDLEALARGSGQAVYHLGNAFETVRAREAGRAAAREVAAKDKPRAGEKAAAK